MSNTLLDGARTNHLSQGLKVLLLSGLVLCAVQCVSQPPPDDDLESGQDAGATSNRRDASVSGNRDASGSVSSDASVPGGNDAGGSVARDASVPGGNDAGGSVVRDASVPGGKDAGGSAGPDAATPPVGAGSCETLPPATDYGAAGPFGDVQMYSGVGPNSNYTMFRPSDSLGRNGFKHPIATWGNGITTTPGFYTVLLSHIASHGFVIIGCNDTTAERPCVSAGLDWLVQQNASGEMAGKLDVTREVTIGYSWGGGAAIDTADRPNVRATVSLHGMPPRQGNAFDSMHSPLLLFTSTGDTFVSADGYVTPNYNKSKVQTFYATLNDPLASHLYVIDIGGAAEAERAPTVAWLRMLACNDRKAREYFYGADCTLCKDPWTSQKKNWPQQDSP